MRVVVVGERVWEEEQLKVDAPRNQYGGNLLRPRGMDVGIVEDIGSQIRRHHAAQQSVDKS